jgi:hypothetical protein
MSSGYESNGYGLVNLDGSVTERARAAGAVAATITKVHHIGYEPLLSSLCLYGI